MSKTGKMKKRTKPNKSAPGAPGAPGAPSTPGGPAKNLKVAGRNHSVSELKKIAHQHHSDMDKKQRIYKIGFWIFFCLALFSVVFSVWAVGSIYSNFQVVTQILDESFERTNLVFDITSSRITSCETEVRECQQELDRLIMEAPLPAE